MRVNMSTEEAWKHRAKSVSSPVMHYALRVTEHSVILLLIVLTFFPTAVSGSSRESARPEPSASVFSPGVDDSAKRNYFTDLKVMTHEGKEVRFYTDILRNRIVLISAFYLNCSTACPLQNVVLSRLQSLLGDRFGRDIFIVSVSVDPENDRPELVREYAKVFDAKKGWTFLTGKKINVDWINYKLGYYTEDPESHPTTYLLGNVGTGHWMKIRPDAKAETLAKHLLDLLEENKTK
jgi:protein SCO1/2